jgi:hypothetical protein
MHDLMLAFFLRLLGVPAFATFQGGHLAFKPNRIVGPAAHDLMLRWGNHRLARRSATRESLLSPCGGKNRTDSKST